MEDDLKRFPPSDLRVQKVLSHKKLYIGVSLKIEYT